MASVDDLSHNELVATSSVFAGVTSCNGLVLLQKVPGMMRRR
ncbi:MAG: hypothetical protein U0519_01015 [Candidatus Gracilibacteria bacterium]